MSQSNYTFEVLVPGVRPEDVQVELSEESYSIAHRVKVTAKARGRYWSESYLIPKKYDASKLQASLNLGILTLTIPLTEGAAPRKIPVLSAPSGPAALA